MSLHVRVYNEECATTMPSDKVALNDLDCFHLVEDIIHRVPQHGSKAASANQAIRDKLIEDLHRPSFTSL